MEGKMAAGSSLPADWLPTNDDREYGHRLALTDSQIDDIAEDMRLWAGANSNRQIARKSCWSLAFKGWMRREAKKMKGNGHEPNRGSVIAAADRLIGSGFRLTPKPGTALPASGQANLFLLSKG